MCERECICKSCRKKGCGECYVGSMEQCREGGVMVCFGYRRSFLDVILSLKRVIK
jgi:hypothetical protein